MGRFEIDLPNNPKVYRGVELIAKPSDKYDSQKTADGLAEFLKCLYEQLPQVVTEKLAKDSRLNDFRRSLSDRV